MDKRAYMILYEIYLTRFGYIQCFSNICQHTMMKTPHNKSGGDQMLLDVASGGFALSLALTNQTDLKRQGNATVFEAGEERREMLEKLRSEQLEKEVGLLVNQIGKIDQPPG